MRIISTKTLKGIVCGLIATSIISIASAAAGVGNTAVSSAETAEVQAKVGPIPVPPVGTSAGGATGASAGSYFPGYQKITVDPAYKYLQMKPGDSESFTVTVINNDNKTIELKPRILITPYTQYFWTRAGLASIPPKCL